MKRFAFVWILMVSAVFADERIHLFLVGQGLVGKELLSQISEGFPDQIQVVARADSRNMYFEGSYPEPMSLEAFIQKIVEMQLPHSVFVDCTSSQEVADSYQRVLSSKIPVVTANKKANSGAYGVYSSLQEVARQNSVSFLYDTNVGAGLPIIHAIQTVKRSGDRIIRIEAILSGTLSYLFNGYDGSVPFSQVVREAQAKGYTEPDPRDDLNGMDMARKFLILAREAGLALEISDIAVERFLPDECFEAKTVTEFYEKLETFDEAFREAYRGKVLRFIGKLENGRATLSLQPVSVDHPFYHLTDTNNIVSITSLYYLRNPIVIKGPGAGATVTAANILSGIIKCGL